MSTELKVLDVKILNTNSNRQAVADLVQTFAQAGKVAAVNLGPAFMRYEAMCPLTNAESITDVELSSLRSLGASANLRLIPAP